MYHLQHPVFILMLSAAAVQENKARPTVGQHLLNRVPHVHTSTIKLRHISSIAS